MRELHNDQERTYLPFDRPKDCREPAGLPGVHQKINYIVFVHQAIKLLNILTDLTYVRGRDRVSRHGNIDLKTLRIHAWVYLAKGIRSALCFGLSTMKTVSELKKRLSHWIGK